MPATSLSLNFETPPVNLKVAIARRSWSASPGVKPAHSIATRIACSWNSGTPSVLPSTFSSSGFGYYDRLLAFAAAQIGMHHVALDRAGPDDRDLDDEVVEGPRLHPRQHRHLRAALDLEGAERVGLADHRVGARVLGRDGREIELDALVLGEEIEGRASCR